MALEFTADVKELRAALRAFFSGRPRRKAARVVEYVDVSAREGEVEFVGTGLEASLAAPVTSSGGARIPFPLFEHVFGRRALLGKGSVQVRIDAGKIKAGTLTLTNPAVALRGAESRIVDLPIDASLVDTLRLSFRVGETDLEQSGLSAKVREARRQATDLIEQAAKILGPLGIGSEALATFVWNSIRQIPGDNS